jgi:hypothetical protein
MNDAFDICALALLRSAHGLRLSAQPWASPSAKKGPRPDPGRPSERPFEAPPRQPFETPPTSPTPPGAPRSPTQRPLEEPPDHPIETPPMHPSPAPPGPQEMRLGKSRLARIRARCGELGPRLAREIA